MEPKDLTLLDPYYFKLYHLDGREYTVQTVPAASLLSVFRFDFFAKIFYCSHRESSPVLARMVYFESIRTLNPMGYEYGKEKEKRSFRDHFRVLDSLISTFSSGEFDSSISVVPLAGDGLVFDGAHRISVLAWAHKDVMVYRFPGTKGPSFDYAYFTSRCTSTFTADLTALEAIEWLDGVRIQISLMSGKEPKPAGLKRILYRKVLKLNRKEYVRLFPPSGIPSNQERFPAMVQIIFYVPSAEDENAGAAGTMTICDPASVKRMAALVLSRKGRGRWRLGGGLLGRTAVSIEDTLTLLAPFVRFLLERLKLRTRPLRIRLVESLTHMFSRCTIF
ncbi:MAG: hypothetical protein J6O51_09795 [Bacteroidales bacterium]|nr:hypothetical protein [Bacteroidales bacterium]